MSMRTGRISHWQLSGCLLAIACASLAACASARSSKVAGAEFDGFWSVQWCDSANPQRECGQFDLVLVQDRSGICGEHFVATPGLSRIDEGGVVLGAVDGRKATLVIESGRNYAKYSANAERIGARLKWEMGEMVEAGISSEPAIIPMGQTLTRKTGAAMQERWQVLKDACRWPEDTPNL